MSPRAYSMEKRGAAAAETRNRILDAARQVLAQGADTGLSIEAIARRAGVSRLTIYYHFQSRPRLLEALYDRLATRGNMQRATEVSRERDAAGALDKLVHALVGFWSSDPGAIRRLHAMAAFDTEIANGMRARAARRQRVARHILRRMAAERRKGLGPKHQNLAANVLSAVTSFEVYDVLARAGHRRQEIIAAITRLARCAVAR